MPGARGREQLTRCLGRTAAPAREEFWTRARDESCWDRYGFHIGLMKKEM
ncbi:hypothetical protein FHU35_13334 [Saccharopolyspora dendranthemae]|uniref:Uncharacterized protein n=1 Tax=Saccharopolyspora dendranthemae TaxID=1181886 RepID=A0A561U5I2_9PSEU|nr:hypothetical protein FHU35_13334 [Saccharopolyspora dendranthemae]